MRVASLNIRHGGGSRIPELVRYLTSLDADILVITEFRDDARRTALKEGLATSGYIVSHPDNTHGKNTVAVASRVAAFTPAQTPLVTDNRHFWAVSVGSIDLMGVYMPLGKAKIPYWEAILSHCQAQLRPVLLIGDFNTGTNDLDKAPNGTPFVASHYLARLASVDLIDVWRSRNPERREYTWFSAAGNGFRLDHAFASPEVDQTVINCSYDHVPLSTRITDHAALILDLNKNALQVPSLVNGAVR